MLDLCIESCINKLCCTSDDHFCPVFISYRVGEAEREAALLQVRDILKYVYKCTLRRRRPSRPPETRERQFCPDLFRASRPQKCLASHGISAYACSTGPTKLAFGQNWEDAITTALSRYLETDCIIFCATPHSDDVDELICDFLFLDAGVRCL